MKKSCIISLFIACVAVQIFADYPLRGWTTDITEAVERAQKENKMLLLNFSGTDWCIWCQKLEGTIFSAPDYAEWADANLVQVLLDFPQNIEQPKQTIRQNQILQQFFGVRGYPTIMLLGANLNPLLQTGYRDAKPKQYIQHLQNDRNINLPEPEKFKKEFSEIVKSISSF